LLSLYSNAIGLDRSHLGSLGVLGERLALKYLRAINIYQVFYHIFKMNVVLLELGVGGGRHKVNDWGSSDYRLTYILLAHLLGVLSLGLSIQNFVIESGFG
jgi:hypothetical protein